jgi:hypothetical protein
MAVQAQFYVASLTRRAPRALQGYAEPVPVGDVEMRAATKAGNEAWASSTPSGTFSMTVIGSALPWFEERLGKDVRITLDDPPDGSE